MHGNINLGNAIAGELSADQHCFGCFDKRIAMDQNRSFHIVLSTDVKEDLRRYLFILWLVALVISASIKHEEMLLVVET